ncbi:hypothetical protein MCEMIEM12_00405 [Burkholderiaceae bacterium]
MRKNPSAHRRKFKAEAQQAYALFVAQFGDLHLDIDRLSPFRRLYIRGEVELSSTMAPITEEHLRKVKTHLLSHPIPPRLAALIQNNSGMRISEPVLASLETWC